MRYLFVGYKVSIVTLVIDSNMAYEEFLLSVMVFAFLWVRRRRAQRRRDLMSWEAARRRRIAQFRLKQRQRRTFFMAATLSGFVSATTTARTIWVKLRSHAFFNEVVSGWSDEEWKQNFRVSRETFKVLCNKLKPSLERRMVTRQPLSVEQRVAVTLWGLGTNVEFHTISHLFGVGISTACVTVRDVCSAIVEKLAPRFITVPCGNELKAVVEGFLSRWGFPQCVGAIDGSHIPIIAPKENATDYFNRKKFHSVVLQALVDCEYKFMDVYVGWPGSVHDARVLANSSLFNKCEDGTLLPNWTRNINGVDIPLLILGDPAYPLTTWLMKPYSDCGNLSRKQRKFNCHVSRARVVVENAFGRLKGRWRSLLKRNDGAVDFLPTYVAACCVLHNICEQYNDSFDEDWLVVDHETVSSEQTSVSSPVTTSTSSGTRIRETLCNYFDSQ